VEAPGPRFTQGKARSAPARLFWFPPAGGNAAIISPWQTSLGQTAELCVAELPGRGTRLSERPTGGFDELVADLTSAVADLADRPFAFIGHSLGALVAFEVTRALRRQGSPLPLWLWACGSEGPATRGLQRRVADLPTAELIEVLREYGGTPAEILAEPELMDVLLPGIRADFALSESYAYRQEPPLEIPIRVLRGSEDWTVEAGLAAGWARETTRLLPERVLAGDHFFVQQHDAELARLAAADFAEHWPTHPYRSLPARAFWRTAVAEPDPEEIAEVWQPAFTVGQDAPILTAGSCFAQHIGRALLRAGMNWYDTEPPPPGLTAAERSARHYGEFSFRTGNIYTAAMLRQWLSWAVGDTVPPADGAWPEGGRYFDPYRPAIEPAGYPSVAAVHAAREVTLAAIRTGLRRACCLMFTLGLTEAWHDASNGTVYPVCPGTVRGRFDQRRHVFRNATFAEVYRDLSAALDLAATARPGLRVILTVSPVPLTATATGGHALVATTYSKSVLRAVAGQLAAESDEVDYFPSYELITGSPFRSRFLEPNLRTVSPAGVAFVMRHFLAAFGPGPASAPVAAAAGGGDPYCDDAILDYYRAR
jgi:surfactin synthase thioesterase subunit